MADAGDSGAMSDGKLALPGASAGAEITSGRPDATASHSPAVGDGSTADVGSARQGAGDAEEAGEDAVDIDTKYTHSAEDLNPRGAPPAEAGDGLAGAVPSSTGRARGGVHVPSRFLTGAELSRRVATKPTVPPSLLVDTPPLPLGRVHTVNLLPPLRAHHVLLVLA